MSYIKQCLYAIFYPGIFNTDLLLSLFQMHLGIFSADNENESVFNARFDQKVRSYRVEWVLSML